MRYDGLRGFIDAAERLGEVRMARGVDANLELGAVTELAHHRVNGPAVLFDEIQGYPAGHRVFVNSLGSASRTALALGLPTGCTWKELVPLARLRAEKKLAKMLLLRRGMRLSVQPVTPREYEVITAMSTPSSRTRRRK